MTAYLRWPLWTAAFVVVATVAWSHRTAVVGSLAILPEARVHWLLLGAGAIGLLYLCRAIVYGIPLRLLDYQVPWTFLWQAAIAASAINQVLPSGGASSYAFLTYALHRRGVPTGQASLIALIDTLSYACAAGTLVIGALAYLATGGHLPGRLLLLGFAPGVIVLLLAVWLYWLQRDQRRIVAVVLRLEQRLGTLLGRTLSAEPVRAFLEEYYKGKAVIVRRPGAFVKMLALQYLAVACDGCALYVSLVSIGLVLAPAVVFLGFVVTLAAGTVVSAPGGGGSFELVMSAFLAEQGVDQSRALAGTLLFRLVSFWLPVLVSGLVLVTFRRHRHEIRRARRRSAGAGESRG